MYTVRIVEANGVNAGVSERRIGLRGDTHIPTERDRWSRMICLARACRKLRTVKVPRKLSQHGETCNFLVIKSNHSK